ncbi:MAG: hypothetical protein KDC44_24135, partial [Phaeodactylibacter sp.]|nr:hypothetical protein [Phaeodactylibacter sp.]
SRDCPLYVEVFQDFHPSTPDYILDGKISVGTLEAEDGQPKNYLLMVSLTDNKHGGVLRSGIATWYDLTDPIEENGSKIYSIEAINRLAETHFKPLDDIIEAHEMIPNVGRVTPAKKEIYVYEKMAVQLAISNAGKPPKPWHWIWVHLKKGTLLNPEAIHFEDYEDGKWWAFEVGTGKLTLNYLAPGECATGPEQITVFNSCAEGLNKEEGRSFNSPADLLGATEFEILCKPVFSYQLELNNPQLNMSTTHFGGFPLTIDDSKVEGYADVFMSYTQTAGHIHTQANFVRTWKISGDLLELEDGRKSFHHTLQDQHIGYGMAIITGPGTQINWNYQFFEDGSTNWSVYGRSGNCILTGGGTINGQFPSSMELTAMCKNGAVGRGFSTVPPYLPAALNTEYIDMNWKDHEEVIFESEVPRAYKYRSEIRLEFNGDLPASLNLQN